MEKFFLISLSWALFSCSSNESDKSIQSIDTIPICTFDQINIKNNNSPKPTAAIITWPRWETGKTIKIKFLDGNEIQHQKVKDIASEWLLYANLQFEYVSTGYADIRIGFERKGEAGQNKVGAWSELGMESAYGINTERQTMRLGSLTATNEASNRRTVLHEFGHALGLIHEQTSPAAKINWNFPKVYKYYNDTMGWSKEQVDEWVIKSSESTNYSEYDPLSIMHYYIDPALTTDGKGVNEMSILSNVDKKSINKWYPFPIVSVLKSGQSIDKLPWKNHLKSPNGQFTLEFVPGVLRVIDLTNNQTVWEVGNSAYERKQSCYFESNGNIIIQGALTGFAVSKTIWTSNTSEFPGAELQLNDDGNLELIYNGIVKWSSKNGKI